MTRAGYKKHFKVIDWFYKQPEGTTVLEKNRILEIWKEVEDPIFSVDNDYLINDEYIDLRKAIYEGKTVECVDFYTGKWVAISIDDSLDPNIIFTYSVVAYRIKPDIKFPTYKKNDFMVVKFVNEEEFEVLFIFDKEKASEFADIGMLIKDENINDKQWKDVPYNEKDGLWDGQPVWCFYFDKSMGRDLRFNNIKDNTIFNFKGERVKANEYNYYEPYPHLEDDWIIEAYNKLKF